jgi:hypothetical protein
VDDHDVVHLVHVVAVVVVVHCRCVIVMEFLFVVIDYLRSILILDFEFVTSHEPLLRNSPCYFKI